MYVTERGCDMSKIIPISSSKFVNNSAIRATKKVSDLNKTNNTAHPTASISSPSYSTSFVGNKFYTTNLNLKAQKSKYPNNRSISFMGKRVHIVDGGNHATNMEHFAHAISNDMNTTLHEVETNLKDKNTKQLKSLELELKKLNKTKEKFEDEYVAIPALASVPILNIQDQYNRVMNENKRFTPENIKANKEQLIKFLSKLYYNPQYYSEYIGYMDSNKQGIQYTYGVIQEINKLIKKGAKVYIPSGHPQDETLKWMAGQRGLKPELYHFIATGYDKDQCIEKMHKEIKDKNWYDFNLLSLSDANIVGVKGAKGAQDYMFAAYDSCITDGARGVYNFSPVREGDKLIGYSYTDTSTNEYPFEEFPANDEVANLVKFVGKSCRSVIATQAETEELKKCKEDGIPTSDCADKLYVIKDIFSEEEIKNQKLDLQGYFVDKSLKLFFNTNSNGEIVFPKCNCEGSGKPSVLSMWGSCFAIFNAIARDIGLEESKKKNWIEGQRQYYHGTNITNTLADDRINKNIDKLRKAKKENNYSAIEKYANIILEDIKFLGTNSNYIDFVHYGVPEECYEALISALIGEKKYDSAENVINFYINYLAQKNEQYRYSKSIPEIVKMLNNTSLLQKQYPGNYIIDTDFKKYLKFVDKVSELYTILMEICDKNNKKYPAAICKAAIMDFKNYTQRSSAIINRRLQGIQYIGDLYPEIDFDKYN